MRRIVQLSMLCLAAGVVNACKPQEFFETTTPPTAGVRFINAVPDTGSMDFRPVDILENTTFYNVAFRGASAGSVAGYLYKNTQAGTRHFRIFRSPTAGAPPAQQIAEAATVVFDLPDQVLEAGKLYTYILWGYSRPGSSPAMRVTLITDDPADPGTQVALRLINAGAGRGAIDGRAFVTASGPPATATWAALSPLSVSSYVNFPPSATISYNVQPAAVGAWAQLTAAAPAGAAETVDADAIPGVNVAGSAVSAIFVPGSVIGSSAAAFISQTGATDVLSATATGYARTAGSFVTQGFLAGDTLTVTGFTNADNNGLAVVTAVTATALTVSKTPANVVEAGAAGRKLVTPRPGIIFVWDRRPPRCATVSPCYH